MRVSDNINKASVIAHALFVVAILTTTVLASFEVFGGSALRSKWSRLIVVVALVGVVYVGLNRDFYMPFLGPTVIPTSLLKVGTPPDASVAVSVDAPSSATHVMYWAASPSTFATDNPTDAYGKFKNAGVVQVAGGRATLRVACPGTYKVGWGRVLPRHLHYRFVFPNGVLSAVKTAAVTCP